MAILRTLFFLLILGNLILFAWGQGLFGRQDDGREPQRLKAQIQPEKLRLVPPATAAAAGASAAATKPPGTPAPLACKVVGGLAVGDADKLRASLAAITGLAVAVRAEAAAPSYWVLIPPLANKAAAEKKAGELKHLGVTDFFIVSDEGPHQFAISLGLFKSDQAAQDFLATLAKKGVRSARVETQQKTPDRSQVEVRGASDAVSKALAGMPPATITDCPAS